MPIPVQSQVEPIVNVHAAKIVEAVFKAWDATAPDRAKYGYKRTQRCMVHEQIVNHIRVTFAGVNGISIQEKHETAYLILNDEVVARVKHGDSNGLGKNNHTETSFAFISPDAEPWELPLGLPNLQRVDITYLLNDIETRIDSIMVTGRDGSRPLWSYPLYPREAMPIYVLPTAPAAPADPGDVIRVPDGGVRKADDKKAG